MAFHNSKATVLNLLFFLCLLFVEFNKSQDDTPNNTHVTVCSTEYKALKQIPNFRFNCSFIIKSEWTENIKCTIIDNRSLAILVSKDHIKGLNSKLICSSNYAITVNVIFQDGMVSEHFFNMTWRREIVDINVFSTYTNHLYLFPPMNAAITLSSSAGWYTFSTLQYPAETINILWYTDLYGLHDYVFWMKDTRELQIDGLKWTENGDAVILPCVSPSEIKIWKYGDNQTDMMRYKNKFFGILLYVTENKIDLLGNYSCYNQSESGRFSFINFSIVPRQSNYSSSYRLIFNDSNDSALKIAFMNTRTSVPEYNQNLTPKNQIYSLISEERSLNYFKRNMFGIEADGWEFELKCQLKGQIPSFKISQNHLYDNSSTDCNPKLNSTIDPFNNQIVYTAVCITSNHQIGKSVTYFCVNENMDSVLEAWEIKKVTELENGCNYLPNNHELECVSTAYEDSLQETSCNNPLICKLMENVVQIKSTCNIKSLCRDQSELCSIIKLPQKGVFYRKYYDRRVAIDDIVATYDFWNMYYVGLNRKNYFGINAEPPKEAIINLRNLGPNEQIMLNNHPVKFTFYCEAHSFYFEEGIQWLFQFKNGSQYLIPSEYLTNHVDASLKQFEDDNGNPSSSVKIVVGDKNIERIICAAPRLSVLKLKNFREWVFESSKIAVFDAIAPLIVQTPTKFSFDKEDLNKEIKCQATGLPKPEIQWQPLSGQNLSRDFIIDVSLYTVVRFPTYNESYEGDYLCTAKNAVGNDSQTISVRTNGSVLSGTQLALVLAAVITLIIAIVVTFYWYIRKLKMKQSMEMEEILQLLRGRTDETTNNVLETPYDTQWELERHSFCIDQCKILGCGEFGIVYKGTIAKLNIDAAFKSLKSSGNMIHLKSLVSELKLLMYIGKYEYIVELYGAYTQEIEKGVIYVAIEFCALGSLERHLRSNKGRFQKCPFLASYFEDSNTLPESKPEVSATFIYTIKSLLKWCSEIASAMDYLYSKKVVHGDLATRNILLTADWNTKLTDFGLSRRTYDSDNYVKKGKDPLPWRWLALESLLTQVFNVKTDVWAFGITLWEIFSLGETPYPGLSPTMEFVGELERGLRNPRPKYASNELYEVMIACWNCDGNERPSFASLRILFENAIQVETFRVDVEDMNPIGSIEEEAIEYFELEEITTNEETT